MNLLEIAERTMKNYQPENEGVAKNYTPIPDGNYDCLIEDITSRKNEKGTEWISIKCSINSGDLAGRFIFANYFMTEKMVEKSIKSLNKLVTDFGFKLPIEAFETMETLQANLIDLVGQNVNVEQITSKNGFTYHVLTTLPF